MNEKPRHYPVADHGAVLAGNYARVIALLSDAELEDEILGGRGEPGYRLALVNEADRRAKFLPGEEDSDG